MYSLMRFSDSLIVEGCIVEATRNRIRAIVPGLDDAIQLRRKGTQWFSENGEPVSFEFLALDLPQEQTVARPMTARAAG
jgi:hypothetical protein